MFDQVSEKALCEILRIVHTVPAAAHETIKRRPIGLAKLRQRGARNLRFRSGFPGREQPRSSESKETNRSGPALSPRVFTLTACIKIAEIGKRQENLNFVQRALRNPFVQGKRRYKYEETSCHPNLLRISSGAGICSAKFEWYKAGTGTTESVTVTGTIIPTPEEGAAAAYQPAKTLVVREDKSNYPGRYVLNGPGHVVDKSGRVVQTAIKPGTRVLVYYISTGDLRMVDHVVVLD